MRRADLRCTRQLWSTTLYLRCRTGFLVRSSGTDSSGSRNEARMQIHTLLNAPTTTSYLPLECQTKLVQCRTFASRPSRTQNRDDDFADLGIPTATSQYKSYVSYDPEELDDFTEPIKADEDKADKSHDMLKEQPLKKRDGELNYDSIIEQGKLPFERTVPQRNTDPNGEKMYIIERVAETQFLKDNLMDTFKINGPSLKTLVPTPAQDHTPPNRFKDMLLTPGLGFFDRTQYLVQMSKGGYEIELSYFRPEGFGKSMVCDMLHFFHGKEYRDFHKFIFKGLAVHDKLYTGQNQNLIPGRFYVLRLDFSPLKKAKLFQDMARTTNYRPTKQDFFELSDLLRGVIRDAVQDYLMKYPDVAYHGTRLKDSSAFKGGKKLVHLLEKFVFRDLQKELHNLYLIIEDYDWLVYAQQLLMKNSKRQSSRFPGSEESQQPAIGGLNDLWLSITHFQKIKRPSMRVVLMGTAPWEAIGLNSVRIASQRTYDRSMAPGQACLAGLRVEELELPLTSIIQHLYPKISSEELRKKVLKHVEWMTRLYGNYRFSDMGKMMRTLNSGACVEYMQTLLSKGATDTSQQMRRVEEFQFYWKTAVSAVQGQPRPGKPIYNELTEVIRHPESPFKGRLSTPFINDTLKSWSSPNQQAIESYRSIVDHFYFWENPDVRQRQEDDSFLYYHGLLAIDPASLSRLMIPNHSALRALQQIFAHSRDAPVLPPSSNANFKRVNLGTTQLYGIQDGSARPFWDMADSKTDNFADLVHSFLKGYKWHALQTEDLVKVRNLFWKYLLAKEADHLLERNPDIADMESEGIILPSNEPYCVIYGNAVNHTKQKAHIFYFYKPETSINEVDDLTKIINTLAEEEETKLENLAKAVRNKMRAFGTPIDRVMVHPVVLLDYAKGKLKAATVEADRQEKDGLGDVLEFEVEAEVEKQKKTQRLDAETLKAKTIRADEGMMAWTIRFQGYPALKPNAPGTMRYEMAKVSPSNTLSRYMDNFNNFFNPSEPQLVAISPSAKHKADHETRAPGRTIKGTFGAFSSKEKKKLFAKIEGQQKRNNKDMQSDGLSDNAVQEIQSGSLNSSGTLHGLEDEDEANAMGPPESDSHDLKDRDSMEEEEEEEEEWSDPFASLNAPTLKYGKRRNKRHPGDLNKGKKDFVKRLEKKRNEMLQDNPDVDLKEHNLSDEDIKRRWEKRRDKRNPGPWKVLRGKW